jgi:hypothetical protein
MGVYGKRSFLVVFGKKRSKVEKRSKRVENGKKRIFWTESGKECPKLPYPARPVCKAGNLRFMFGFGHNWIT